MMKNIVHTFHLLFIFITLFGWTVYTPCGILMPIVGMSWEINNNQCLLTQFEKKMFNNCLIPGRITKKNRIFLWVDMCTFVYFTCVH